MSILQRSQTPDSDISPSETSERLQETLGLSQSNRSAERRALEARQAALATGDPKKTASAAAFPRLELAEQAIEYTKEVFEFGAGNQAEALYETGFNSYFRMKVVRNPKYWIMTESVKMLAAKNPNALRAAKAEIAQGGNCGEHASVAFEYLRATGCGERITRGGVDGIDHAFVLIGDLGKDADNDIVVSDPWPTAAECCLWEDHFCFTPDRSLIGKSQEATCDGKDIVKVIKRGLKLTGEGRQKIKESLSQEESEQRIEDGSGSWIWGHPDASAEGQDYDYELAPSPTTSQSGE